MLEESPIWDSKIWSWVPRDSDPRMNALARASSNCKRQTRDFLREDAPHQQTRNCLTVIKIWSWAPDGCLTPRQTDRLTVGRNITLTMNLTSVVVSVEICSREKWEAGSWGRWQFGEPEERGTSDVGSRYQLTASEEREDLICAVVTVIFGVCKWVSVTSSSTIQQSNSGFEGPTAVTEPASYMAHLLQTEEMCSVKNADVRIYTALHSVTPRRRHSQGSKAYSCHSKKKQKRVWIEDLDRIQIICGNTCMLLQQTRLPYILARGRDKFSNIFVFSARSAEGNLVSFLSGT
jgi:hypothetical protein